MLSAFSTVSAAPADSGTSDITPASVRSEEHQWLKALDSGWFRLVMLLWLGLLTLVSLVLAAGMFQVHRRHQTYCVHRGTVPVQATQSNPVSASSPGMSTYCYDTHTHTHTHPFNGPFSRNTRVSRYQKGNTNLDFTEARDSEWQWHQLSHRQVCTFLQTDNHASTPRSIFLQAGCPSCHVLLRVSKK